MSGIRRKFIYWLWRWPFFYEQWRLGLLRGDLEALMQGARPDVQDWSAVRPWKFLADPFHARLDGQDWLFAEAFDYRDPKGRIVEARFDGKKLPDHFDMSLETPFHLSYPFPVLRHGKIMLLPEAWEAGAIATYSRGGQRVDTLVADCPGVDPTLYFHEGRWWLFATRQDRGANEELYLWYSEAPEGPFIEHPGNPVVRDIRRARPGGALFEYNGRLYRPVQDCSKTYGGSLRIMEITRLDETAFEQEDFLHLKPQPGSVCPDGLHSLCLAGERVIIDGKKWRFSPFAFAVKLRMGRLNRLRRQGGGDHE